MENPSPNQLPPKYTGPEAPIANPELLDQQDLRYGIMELTDNIQKIIESGIIRKLLVTILKNL